MSRIRVDPSPWPSRREGGENPPYSLRGYHFTLNLDIIVLTITNKMILMDLTEILTAITTKTDVGNIIILGGLIIYLAKSYKKETESTINEWRKEHALQISEWRKEHLLEIKNIDNKFTASIQHMDNKLATSLQHMDDKWAEVIKLFIAQQKP